MKYIITENRVYDVMFEYLKRYYPTLAVKDPLRILRKSKNANSGYGSGLDDYVKITTYYLDEDETPWFKHFDDRDIYESSKWEVNEELETMYNMFGLGNFEKFIKQYFNLDITEKGNKEYDWVFR